MDQFSRDGYSEAKNELRRRNTGFFFSVGLRELTKHREDSCSNLMGNRGSGESSSGSGVSFLPSHLTGDGRMSSSLGENRRPR